MMYQRLSYSYKFNVDPKRLDRLSTPHAQQSLYAKLVRNCTKLDRRIMLSRNVRVGPVGVPEMLTIEVARIVAAYFNGAMVAAGWEIKYVKKFRQPFVIETNGFKDVLPEHANILGPQLDTGKAGEKVYVQDYRPGAQNNGHTPIEIVRS